MGIEYFSICLSVSTITRKTTRLILTKIKLKIEFVSRNKPLNFQSDRDDNLGLYGYNPFYVNIYFVKRLALT